MCCCKKPSILNIYQKGFECLEESSDFSIFNFPESLLLSRAFTGHWFQFKNKSTLLATSETLQDSASEPQCLVKVYLLFLYCTVWEQPLKNMFMSFVLHYEARLAPNSSFAVQHQAHFAHAVA